MSIIDTQHATSAELSEELIFLIAAVSTDAQRKHAIDLFRCFARQVEAEAFRRGQESIERTVVPPSAIALLPPPAKIDPVHPNDRVSLIPPIKWQE